jgi:hypothetical protein
MSTTLTFDKTAALAQLAQFEKHYNYDTSYAQAILEADPVAFQLYENMTQMGRYAQNIPKDALFAAKLTAIAKEDCGPCTQLTVQMAEEAGVSAEVLNAVLAGDMDAMPDDVRLVYQFTEAAMAHSMEADAFRESILSRWGTRALISLSFSIIAAKSFSGLRYSMGYGQACSRILVNGQPAKLKNRN